MTPYAAEWALLKAYPANGTSTSQTAWMEASE